MLQTDRCKGWLGAKICLQQSQWHLRELGFSQLLYLCFDWSFCDSYIHCKDYHQEKMVLICLMLHCYEVQEFKPPSSISNCGWYFIKTGMLEFWLLGNHKILNLLENNGLTNQMLGLYLQPVTNVHNYKAHIVFPYKCMLVTCYLTDYYTDDENKCLPVCRI